jgi:hypothetical protein
MTDRPKRATRSVQKFTPQETAPKQTGKRKAENVDPEDQLDFMLHNPKSPLTTTDIFVGFPTACVLNALSDSTSLDGACVRFPL